MERERARLEALLCKRTSPAPSDEKGRCIFIYLWDVRWNSICCIVMHEKRHSRRSSVSYCLLNTRNGDFPMYKSSRGRYAFEFQAFLFYVYFV